MKKKQKRNRYGKGKEVFELKNRRNARTEKEQAQRKNIKEMEGKRKEEINMWRRENCRTEKFKQEVRIERKRLRGREKRQKEKVSISEGSK